jgi:hypothetical protein
MELIFRDAVCTVSLCTAILPGRNTVTYRIFILIGFLAAVVGLIVLLPQAPEPFQDVDPIWFIRADQPLVIGGYGDNFCYDGEGVQELEGSMWLSIGPDERASIYASVSTTQDIDGLQPSPADKLVGNLEIVARAEDSIDIKQDLRINGELSNGSASLPPTNALLAGQSVFDLYLEGKLLYKDLIGQWSVADGLRRADGSMRQSGLIYSPLLRDKTGFSDPKRKEVTLILHSDAPDKNNQPQYSFALHLVFLDVVIDKQPAAQRSD